jgi:hypothetical protein
MRPRSRQKSRELRIFPENCSAVVRIPEKSGELRRVGQKPSELSRIVLFRIILAIVWVVIGYLILLKISYQKPKVKTYLLANLLSILWVLISYLDIEFIDLNICIRIVK